MLEMISLAVKVEFMMLLHREFPREGIEGCA
jgi:hypothetical protein